MNKLLNQFLARYGVGRYPIHEAIFDKARLIRMLRQSYDLEARLPTGESPLHLAAQLALDDIVLKLLESGADVEAVNEGQNTALHFSVYPLVGPLESFETSLDATFQCCRMLVKHHANINCLNKAGHSPLVLAMKAGNEQIVELLLMKGANLEVADAAGWTALHYACFSAKPRYVELLVQRGAARNSRADDGETPEDVLASLDRDDFGEQVSAIREILGSPK